MLNEGNQIHNLRALVIPFYCGSGFGSGTAINYGSGSGSDFLARYGGGSDSASQKVTVPTVPVPQRWRTQPFFYLADLKPPQVS
jgi:hypothetical protein